MAHLLSSNVDNLLAGRLETLLDCLTLGWVLDTLHAYDGKRGADSEHHVRVVDGTMVLVGSRKDYGRVSERLGPQLENALFHRIKVHVREQENAMMPNLEDFRFETYHVRTLRLGDVSNLAHTIQAQGSSALEVLAKHLIIRQAHDAVLHVGIDGLHDARTALQATVRDLHRPQTDGLLTGLGRRVRRDPVVGEARIGRIVVRLVRKERNVHASFTQSVVKL